MRSESRKEWVSLETLVVRSLAILCSCLSLYFISVFVYAYGQRRSRWTVSLYQHIRVFMVEFLRVLQQVRCKTVL